MKCNNCGAEVVGSDFCFNCGEKVEKFESDSDICPKCGTKNKKDTFLLKKKKTEIVAEKVKIDSLEKETFNENYYEILDRYEDQLEHVRLLEAELTELGERRPKASTAEIMAKRTKEIVLIFRSGTWYE